MPFTFDALVLPLMTLAVGIVGAAIVYLWLRLPQVQQVDLIQPVPPAENPVQFQQRFEDDWSSDGEAWRQLRHEAVEQTRDESMDWASREWGDAETRIS